MKMFGVQSVLVDYIHRDLFTRKDKEKENEIGDESVRINTLKALFV